MPLSRFSLAEIVLWIQQADVVCYQEYYNRTAKPFTWKFTRRNLQERLRALADIKSENL